MSPRSFGQEVCLGGFFSLLMSWTTELGKKKISNTKKPSMQSGSISEHLWTVHYVCPHRNLNGIKRFSYADQVTYSCLENEWRCKRGISSSSSSPSPPPSVSLSLRIAVKAQFTSLEMNIMTPKHDASCVMRFACLSGLPNETDSKPLETKQQRI